MARKPTGRASAGRNALIRRKPHLDPSGPNKEIGSIDHISFSKVMIACQNEFGDVVSDFGRKLICLSVLSLGNHEAFNMA